MGWMLYFMLENTVFLTQNTQINCSQFERLNCAMRFKTDDNSKNTKNRYRPVFPVIFCWPSMGYTD